MWDLWRLFYQALLPNVPCHDCPPGNDEDDDDDEEEEEDDDGDDDWRLVAASDVPLFEVQERAIVETMMMMNLMMIMRSWVTMMMMRRRCLMMMMMMIFLQPVKYRCSRCKRERYRIEMEEVNSFLILILTRAARNNSSLNPGGGYPSHYHPISCLFWAFLSTMIMQLHLANVHIFQIPAWREDEERAIWRIPAWPQSLAPAQP